MASLRGLLVAQQETASVDLPVQGKCQLLLRNSGAASGLALSGLSVQVFQPHVSGCQVFPTIGSCIALTSAEQIEHLNLPGVLQLSQFLQDKGHLYKPHRSPLSLPLSLQVFTSCQLFLSMLFNCLPFFSTLFQVISSTSHCQPAFSTLQASCSFCACLSQCSCRALLPIYLHRNPQQLDCHPVPGAVCAPHPPHDCIQNPLSWLIFLDHPTICAS